MRKLPVIIFLTIVFYSHAFAQANDAPCPNVSVTGPSSVVNPGDDVIFTVMVSDMEPDKVVYVWTVSAGQITSGQGTPVINVSTTGLSDSELKANVEVKGLPDKCSGSWSETASLRYICKLPITVDAYGKLPVQEEKARLDSAAIELLNNPGFALYFVISYPKETNMAALKKRILTIEHHFVDVRKIDKNRINFVNGGEGTYSTRIYMIPFEDGIDTTVWGESFDKPTDQTKPAKINH